MTITPDKSALEKARERLEAECVSWSKLAVALRGRGDLYEPSAIDSERNASDLRLVLDALKEAERKLDTRAELHARDFARDLLPRLVCGECSVSVGVLRDGLCNSCFERAPQEDSQ